MEGLIALCSGEQAPRCCVRLFQRLRQEGSCAQNSQAALREFFYKMAQQQKHWDWKVKVKKHDNPRLTLKNESCKIKRYFFLQFFQPAFSLLTYALWENHLAVAFIRYLAGKKRGRVAGYEYTGKRDALACNPAPQYLRILTIVEANSMQYKHSGWCIRVHQEQPASILCGSGRLPRPPRPLYTYQRLDTAQPLKNWETRKLIEMWLLQCFWLMFKRRWKICDLPPASCFS